MNRTVTTPAVEVRSEGRRLTGYAAVYNSSSRDLGGFVERIAPGAFDQVLDTNPDVVLTMNHNPDLVLARTTSGTLHLNADERGLAFAADLPDSPLGENVRQAVARRDLNGASFRFVVHPDGERWDGETRTLTRVAELLDVTVATRGAYPAATVELRTVPQEATLETETIEAAEATTETTETAEERAQEPITRGTLRVEDRTGETPASVGDRVRDALLDVRPGENRTLSTASTLAPGELSTHLFDRLRAASVALASGIQVVTTERDSVTFPRLTADVDPSWYGEGDTIAAGDPTLDSITATPRKLAHRVEFTNEVIEDSAPSAIDVVTANMVAALGLKLDAGIYQGTGTAPQIRGLKSTAGVGIVSLGANGGQITNLDPFADALAQLDAANAGQAVIVMGPRTWNTVRKLKDSQGRPLVGNGSQDAPATIYGARVFVSSQLSTAETVGTSTDTASVYVYAPAHLYLVRRADVTVELDRSRLFNDDKSELRGKLRADLITPNPSAVTIIEGVRP